MSADELTRLALAVLEALAQARILHGAGHTLGELSIGELRGRTRRTVTRVQLDTLRVRGLVAECRTQPCDRWRATEAGIELASEMWRQRWTAQEASK